MCFRQLIHVFSIKESFLKSTDFEYSEFLPSFLEAFAMFRHYSKNLPRSDMIQETSESKVKPGFRIIGRSRKESQQVAIKVIKFARDSLRSYGNRLKLCL